MMRRWRISPALLRARGFEILGTMYVSFSGFSFVMGFLVTSILSLSLSLGISSEPPMEVALLRCHDADTCQFRKANGDTIKVRFSGVDAPEKKQPFSREATEFVTSKLKDQKVTLRCEGQSFDRRVCAVSVGNADVGADLVRMGYAWDAPKHSKGRYQTLENEARAAKRGLWSLANVQSPTCQRLKTKGAKRNCRSNPLYRE